MTKLSSTYPIALTFDQYQITVLTDESGEFWWFADEVCAALGLDNSRMALTRLNDDEKGVIIADTVTRGPQRKATINESGFYSLILRSRKPEAKRFKRWVTHEVLPSIRKTGTYSTQPHPDVTALAREVASLREQLTTPTRPALPPPPKTDPRSVAQWGAALTDAETQLAEAKRTLNRLEPALNTLGKLQRPVIAPAPVPRGPLPQELPFEGRYYWAGLTHSPSIGRNTMALPLNDRTIALSSATWWTWLGGDPEAARVVGQACDHFGLAPEAVGETIARLVR